ncbi:MAG: Cytochrome [Acidobacteriota bacterium]|nr:Cytochrome [Acidobacteriota bacterium]
MYRKYINFIRGLSVNRVGLTGVVLTTSAFICFLFFELLRISRVLTNAYIGLITYMLFPALFILGLILIPIGWYRYRKSRKLSTKEILAERFIPREMEARGIGSRVFVTVSIFTIINIIFIGAAGIRTLKFMDESVFCGTACHKVMNPEWTTYQVSPHARVKCVECHVGEGITALVDSKFSGLRQMVKANFNTYTRPIPTPVHQLRPARETCEKCHWPEKFYGQHLKILTRYDPDAASTRRYVTLSLKIDTGKEAAKGGIHWHIAGENEVRYASIADRREEMLWVEKRQPNGTFKRFVNRPYAGSIQTEAKERERDNTGIRTMDCVDCHNRATHIYEDPAHALDDRFGKGLIRPVLPYAKREMLAAITPNYKNQETALAGISAHLNGFYRRNYPQIADREQGTIDGMIDIARDIYRRNVHPLMKIRWGTYPSFIGHEKNSGCFRCHNEHMQDEAGHIISYDCTLCHSILAYGEDSPFKYLETPDKKSPQYKMHEFLREEFLKK